MTFEQILGSIDDVLDGNKPVYGWEALLYHRHTDEFTKYWAERCQDIAFSYPADTPGTLISEDGIKELRKLREELVNSAGSKG